MQGRGDFVLCLALCRVSLHTEHPLCHTFSAHSHPLLLTTQNNVTNTTDLCSSGL